VRPVLYAAAKNAASRTSRKELCGALLRSTVKVDRSIQSITVLEDVTSRVQTFVAACE